jgi:hypothetical protein
VKSKKSFRSRVLRDAKGAEEQLGQQSGSGQSCGIGIAISGVTRPGKLSQNLLKISACDPPRKTEPKPVGDFGLRGSVCARLAGCAKILTLDVSESDVMPKWKSGCRS